MLKESIELKVGDVYLRGVGCNLSEIEIIQISKEASAIKTKHSWISITTFLKDARGKIGHYEYRRNIFGIKKKIFIPIK